MTAPPAVSCDLGAEPQLCIEHVPWTVGAVVVMDDDGPSRKSAVHAQVTNLLWYMATDRPTQFRRALLRLVRRRADAELNFALDAVPAVRGDCMTHEDFAAFDYIEAHGMRVEIDVSMVLPLNPLRFTSQVADPTEAGRTLHIATDGSYGALFGVSTDEMARCLERGAELRAAAKLRRIADAEQFRRSELDRRLRMLSQIAGHRWERAWGRHLLLEQPG